MNETNTSWPRVLRSAVLLLAAVFASTCLIGCAGQIVTGVVEKGIKKRLPELIGPAESYDVEVSGPTTKIVKGRLAEVVIHGTRVQAVKDIELATLEVHLKDVVADPHTSTVKSIGDVTFSATVTQAAVNQYLARSHEDWMKVQFTPGKIAVRARPKLMRLSTTVEVYGRLVTRGGKLNLAIDRMEVADIGTPSIAVGVLEDRINPVLDLTSMWGAPRLESATVTDGGVCVTGRASPTGLVSAEGGVAKPKN